MRSIRGLRLRLHRTDESGQSLAIVTTCIALLVVVPMAVQTLATGQAQVSTNAVLTQQALQAARSGLSDYINHVTTASNYMQYCSNGAFSQCTTSVDSSNPAFASSAGTSTSSWATVQSVSSIDKEAFSYLVDTHNVSNGCGAGAQSYPVYVTGRAGAFGHYVYQELEANLSVTNASWGCGAPISSQSYGSCSSNGYPVTVPTGATYAVVSLYGAQGGGLSSTPGGGGDGYEVYNAYVPVVAGETWDVSVGEAGGGSQFEILSLNLFGVGGRSCLGNMNLGGGNNGSALLGVLTQNGGGGGGATGICVDGSGAAPCTSSSVACTWNGSAFATTPCVLAVAAGGGGQGGLSGGQGGYNASTSPAGNGASGGGGSGSGGSVGGSSNTSGKTGGGTLLAVGSGFGGGGGGGFPHGGGGGGAGGLCILFVCLLGPGGGGGSGSIPATPPKPVVTCPAPTIGPQTTYPVPGASAGSANGLASITFYSGTACAGTALNVTSLTALDIQPVPIGTT